MAHGALIKDLRMKLRIKGNSLRLRISQSEVKQLKDNLQITEEIRFSKDNALRYTLQNQPGINTIKADYSENSLRISLPELLAKDWLNSDQVGLEGIQENSENDRKMENCEKVRREKSDKFDCTTVCSRVL